MNKLKSFFLRNTLISNALYFTISSAISKIISILLIYIYLNYLSVEEYGLFDYFFIIATLINLTFSLEITQGLARYLPAFKGFINKKILLSTSVYLLLFSSIIFVLIFFQY